MTEPEDPTLLSVVYTSVALEPFDGDRLAALLAHSRVANGEADVTGFLLHREGRFIQFLEGPARTVRQLVTTIASDRRHGRVRVLLEDEVPTRQFAEWTMGYEPTDGSDASLPEGFRRSFDDLEAGEDPSLMEQAASDLTRWFRARPQPAA
jgi:hypothetical protein